MSGKPKRERTGGRKKAVGQGKLANKSLKDILGMMSKYNKEHGTNYNYGVFVSFVEGGRINVGKD